MMLQNAQVISGLNSSVMCSLMYVYITSNYSCPKWSSSFRATVLNQYLHVPIKIFVNNQQHKNDIPVKTYLAYLNSYPRRLKKETLKYNDK